MIMPDNHYSCFLQKPLNYNYVAMTLAKGQRGVAHPLNYVARTLAKGEWSIPSFPCP